MKIFTVIGARPQFIKAAMVSKQLKKAGLKEILVHTGQHFDANMSAIFFEQMQIPKPSYELGIHSSSHGKMTGEMLGQLDELMQKEQPDFVLVYGDTNSTLAGALAASKLHIPIAHVEAGLRSFNMQMPEEINRIVTDRLSAKLFCPTNTAKNNLINEGFLSFDCQISISGDVMYDAALHFSQFPCQTMDIEQLCTTLPAFVLATIHRAENTNDASRLRSIFSGLDKINQEIPVVMPLHPRTRQFVEKCGIDTKVKLIEPVGYIEMLHLLRHCQFVVTDSGGLQKEAYFFRKYCLTARDETEWVELVEDGYNMLVGANENRIFESAQKILTQSSFSESGLYGDGKSAEYIVKHLMSEL